MASILNEDIHTGRSWSKSIDNQSGSVLIISLMMLVVMTMIGLSASRVTTFEEKMAGNHRNVNVSFQAAESALRDAESTIENLANTTSFDSTCTNGLCSTGHAPDDPFAETTWTSFSAAYSGTLTGVGSQPRYYIEHVGQISEDSGTEINIGGYGDSTGQGSVTAFRVVARGKGGSDQAESVVEIYYGKRL